MKIYDDKFLFKLIGYSYGAITIIVTLLMLLNRGWEWALYVFGCSIFLMVLFFAVTIRLYKFYWIVEKPIHAFLPPELFVPFPRWFKYTSLTILAFLAFGLWVLYTKPG